MAFEVLRTPQVRGAVEQRMSRTERASYHAARDELGTPPTPATIGRRRQDKPPCCEDNASPPPMNDELRKLLDQI